MLYGTRAGVLEVVSAVAGARSTGKDDPSPFFTFICCAVMIMSARKHCIIRVLPL